MQSDRHRLLLTSRYAVIWQLVDIHTEAESIRLVLMLMLIEAVV